MSWGVNKQTGGWKWYRVAWNLIWFLPYITGKALCCLCVLAVFGIEDSKREWFASGF